MKNVGFIGVGSIGAPMARCVIRAGFHVLLCDSNPKALEPFAKSGAQLTDSIAACVDMDVVIVMVANDMQVKEVIMGESGLLSAVKNNHIPRIAVMSTVLPQTIQEVVDACLKKDVPVIDAPVSGLPVVAEQGKLTIIVGGSKRHFEEMHPVLQAMGKNIFHTGPHGSGEVTKLVNNIIGVTNLFLTVEAMSVAKEYGMNLDTVAKIVETSSGRNFSTRDWQRAQATFAYFAKNLALSKVAVDLSRKDLSHALELAQKANVSCPLLDGIVKTVNQLSYEEVQTAWSGMEDNTNGKYIS